MTRFTLKLSILIILYSITTIVITIHTADAQLESSPTQEHTGPERGLLMQFSYSPASPAINSFTTLSFNVLNSTTDKPLQNFAARVTVGNVVNFTGGSGYYNFSSIQVPDGNFSVNYAFPNDGIFPIFLRVDTPTIIDVAKFQVNVPPPTVIPSNDYTMIYVGIAIAAAGAGVGIAMILRRKTKTLVG
jgi:hypothetical protein